MADIATDLQRAIFARLTTYAPLAPLIADRVFDSVPATGLVFPYVTIFDVQLIEDGTECSGGDEVYFDVHVWSRERGAFEAKSIAGHVRSGLHEFNLPLGADHALVSLEFETMRVLRDGDGLTTHCVVTFHGFTQTP